MLQADLDDAGHVGRAGPVEDLGDSLEEDLESGRRGVDEQTQRPVTAVAKGVMRTARQEDRRPHRHLGPDPVLPKLRPPFHDVEPFVLAMVTMRRRPPARRSDNLHHRKRPARLLAAQENSDFIAKGGKDFGIGGESYGRWGRWSHVLQFG